MSRTAPSLLLAVVLAVVASPWPGRAEGVSGREAVSVDALNELVAIDATLSGAADACHFPVAFVILRCTGLTIRNWTAATGLAPFRSTDAALKLGKAAWDPSFARAKDAQSSLEPPLTCAEVARRAVTAPVLKVCAPDGYVGPYAAPSGSMAPSTGMRVQ